MTAAACPRRIGPRDDALTGVLTLILTTFAYMEGRTDAPAAALGLTLRDVAAAASCAEIWAIEEEDRVIACVTLAPDGNVLSLSNLAVATTHRGRGFARELVDLAAERARALGFRAVELQSQVELTEIFSAFSAMGFHVAGEITPAGAEHPTSITFARPA